MDEDEMRHRVRAARVAHLATVTSAGHPHVVPCCFALAGERRAVEILYSAIDAKPKSTTALRRLANLHAHPRASLLVDHYSDDWSTLWWVRVDGPARVLEGGVERDDALALLTRKYPVYTTEPPPGPVIAIVAEAWRAWP